MTNYNEGLDEILRELDRGEYLGKGGVPGAKQAITSLIKELVAEAKPEYRVINGIQGIINGNKSIAVDQYEQNLIKALEEV